MSSSLAPPTSVLIAAILFSSPSPAAQQRAFGLHEAVSEIEDIRRPRLAFAADGSFVLAAEVLSQDTFESSPVLKVAARRFSSAGVPIGPWQVFTGENCSTIDIWTSDYMSHAEVAIRPDGNLLVLMQHSGRFSIGPDDIGSAEVTIGGIDRTGQRIDLNASTTCSQQKLIFPGAHRQDRPRMALAPDGGMLVTSDGFFDGSDLRNVAIRVLDSSLSTLLEQAIPHADPLSQQAFHMSPDVSTNGTLGLSVWQRCPVIDSQGNASECDIGAQFFSSPISASPSLIGGNLTVTSGDPPGTVSIWPAAAMNASGASVVAWFDTRTSPTGDIFGQRYNASGQAVGDNFQISATQGAVYDRPEVAMLPSGDFLVAWTDSSALGFQARGRRYDSNGQSLGPPFRFVETAGIQSGYPHIAAVGSNFEAIWLEGREGEVPGLSTSHVGPITTATPESTAMEVALLPAVPNPFVHHTRIPFTLRTPGPAQLFVYDATGRQIAVLLDDVLPAGTHRATWNASALPAGVYQARLTANGTTVTRRLVHMR